MWKIKKAQFTVHFWMLRRHSTEFTIVSFLDSFVRRNLPLLLLRVMLNFYISNFVRVSWSGYFSEYFWLKKA